MAWKECNKIDEKFRFVAQYLDGEKRCWFLTWPPFDWCIRA